MAKSWPFKDPGETLDYTIDWTNRMATGDSIVTSVWTITGQDALLLNTLSTIASPLTTIWLSGGTLGIKYTISNAVTTAQSRVMEQSVTLLIKPK